MTLWYHPAAMIDAMEATLYYDQQEPGLGRRFERALESAERAIVEAPERWPRHMAQTRRYRLKRFPYGVVYRVQRDTIGIFAVMHLHRKPGYWVSRMPTDERQ